MAEAVSPGAATAVVVLKSEAGQVLGRFENVTLRHHEPSGAVSQIQVSAPDVQSLHSISAANVGKMVEVEIDGQTATRAVLSSPLENGVIGMSSAVTDPASHVGSEEEAINQLTETFGK